MEFHAVVFGDMAEPKQFNKCNSNSAMEDRGPAKIIKIILVNIFQNTHLPNYLILRFYSRVTVGLGSLRGAEILEVPRQMNGDVCLFKILSYRCNTKFTLNICSSE